MIKSYTIKDARIEEVDDGEVTVVCQASDEELGRMMEKFKLDSYDVHAAMDPDENGRMEAEDGYVFIILKGPKNYSGKDNLLFKVVSIGVFLFSGKMLIISRGDAPLFEQNDHRHVQSILDVLVKLAHTTILHFQQHLNVINSISEDIEAKINTSMENKYLVNMFTIEKSLVYYLNAINGNGAVLSKLRTQAQRLGLNQANIDSLDEIIIENNQCLSMAQTHSDIMSSLMDARASLVGNNLNAMMKNLNALVIAVAIPSFFAGVGGMSELSEVCEKFKISHALAYMIFFIGMIGAGAVIFFTIRRSDKL